MAITYTQTDTVAPCGVIQACDSVVPAADADAIEAQDGGTAGSTELACDIAAGSSELCFATELAITDATSLDSGTLTMRINVTGAQNNLTWESIHVCRVNSSCTSQETLGSVTGLGVDVSAGGVFSQNVSLSAASAHNAGDKIYITCVFANSHSMTSRTINITPDQNVDTPFNIAQTVQESVSDGPSMSDTQSDSIVALESTADGVSSGDDVTDSLLVTESLSDGSTAGDSQTEQVVIVVSESVSDGLSLSDNESNQLTSAPAVNDGVLSGDTVSPTALSTASVTDGAQAGDTQTDIKLITASVSDGAEAGDTESTTLQATESPQDGVSSGDSAAESTPVPDAGSDSKLTIRFSS